MTSPKSKKSSPASPIARIDSLNTWVEDVSKSNTRSKTRPPLVVPVVNRYFANEADPWILLRPFFTCFG